MSALEPGLYRATVRGVPDTIVMIRATGFGFTHDYIAGVGSFAPDEITDARPLVVIEEPKNVQREYWPRFVMLLRDNGWHLTADQIEAQTRPARIPEPGWDGKVLAHTFGNDTRREFVRHGRRERAERFNWSDGTGYGSNHWADLINPVLIREGLS